MEYKDLEIFKDSRSSTIYKKDDKLIKVYNLNFLKYENLEPQILFNIDLNKYNIDNIILPTKAIYQENKFIGYEMPYIESVSGSSIFKEKDIPFDLKIKYINLLSNALSSLHNHIIVGDIHLGNILLSKNNIFLTDFDYSIPADNNNFAISKNRIINNKRLPLDENITTDINKLFLVILSLLYNTNIESLAFFNSFSTNNFIVQLLNEIKAPESLINYAYNILANENAKSYQNYLFLNSEKLNENNLNESKIILERKKSNYY